MDDADAIEDALGVRVPDDDRLWVRLKPDWTPDPAWKWRIFGSAQTYAGHFHVCAIGHDEHHQSVNVADVVEFAPAARLWLSGLLAGQEITRFQFMGSSVELLDTMTEADEERWRDWNIAFRRRGYELPLDELLEVDEPALATVHDPPAWAFIAGQFWTYSATAGRRPTRSPRRSPATSQPSGRARRASSAATTTWISRSARRSSASIATPSDRAAGRKGADCHLPYAVAGFGPEIPPPRKRSRLGSRATSALHAGCGRRRRSR